MLRHIVLNKDINMGYRKPLQKAVEIFLGDNADNHQQAQKIIHDCYVAINNDATKVTIDAIIWGFFIIALTDSIYYENNNFLRGTREILLGTHSFKRLTTFHDDFQPYFTNGEIAWHAELVSMLDFLATIPFQHIHRATKQARANRESWASMLTSVPEVMQAVKFDEEYEQRKSHIEDIAANCPTPENMGAETIFHLVLREVTDILTALRIGQAAVYYGYPGFNGPYTSIGMLTEAQPLDATEHISWAKKMLTTLIGKETLFLSWQLRKTANAQENVLMISLH
jgi:hypothetical protein